MKRIDIEKHFYDPSVGGKQRRILAKSINNIMIYLEKLNKKIEEYILIKEEGNKMNNEYFWINNGQIVLQLSDKEVIDKDFLEEFLHINFKTGEMDKEYWSKEKELIVIQFFMQLYDKQFISKEVLLKKIFGEKEEKE